MCRDSFTNNVVNMLQGNTDDVNEITEYSCVVGNSDLGARKWLVNGCVHNSILLCYFYWLPILAVFMIVSLFTITIIGLLLPNIAETNMVGH